MSFLCTLGRRSWSRSCCPALRSLGACREVQRSRQDRGSCVMTKTVYGLEEAPADFDEHFGTVSEDLCNKFGSLCLTRLMSEPAAFQSKLTGVMMDDGVLVGPDESLDRTLTVMGKILLLKTSCPQLGSETKFLGRLLIKTDRGFLVKPLAKLFDSVLSCAGLENCNAVHSPGVRSESRVPDEKPLLGPAEHSLYRTIVGKLMFIAAERPDIQFFVKQCARGVQSPSARDMQKAKRICRYLTSTRDWTLKAHSSVLDRGAGPG